jgi:hypothetical protein
MDNLIYTTQNFNDKKISVKRAAAILAKSKIQVDDNEAAIILNFLYEIAKTYNKIDSDQKPTPLSRNRTAKKMG